MKKTGTLSVTSKGFGFVQMDSEKDIFVDYHNLANAMDGDTVEVKVFGKSFGKNPAGKITKVIERSRTDILGVIRYEQEGAKVYPEDDRLKSPLFIPSGALTPAEAPGEKKKKEKPKEGQLVVAGLKEWKDPKRNPIGYIKEILGFPEDPQMDIVSVAKSKELSLEFPKKVREAVKKIKPGTMDEEKKNRLDLRNRVCFTIDPKDAKDFDDALSLRQKKNGRLELGVHIADVSHYVPEGSIVDKEAWERGTSVYFVQHVIPMLPERLSNDICSLVPKKDRLAFSVLMEVDSLGTVHNVNIGKSIIRSRARLTYEEVEDIIHGKAHDFAGTIHLMHMLAQVLQKQREEQGSIDFDIPETILSLDENGIPYEIAPSKRLHAHRVVEEFMLLANRTIAEYVENENKERQKELPFIYRIHEKPERDEVESFVTLLNNLGIPYQLGDDIEPEDFKNILDIVENFEFKSFFEKVALRSMTKACYSTENAGHFGLSFDAYTHFTSPIRRYPDLVVHRLMQHYLGKGKPKNLSGLRDYLDKTCAQSSKREKLALEAEREYTKIKSMEFLEKKLEEEYEGIISGVTSFGIFVEITHYMVEGLVHISTLKDDYYHFDEDNYQLTGEKTGNTLRLGDKVRIRVHRVSKKDREADFVLVDSKG